MPAEDLSNILCMDPRFEEFMKNYKSVNQEYYREDLSEVANAYINYALENKIFTTDEVESFYKFEPDALENLLYKDESFQEFKENYEMEKEWKGKKK